GLNLLLESGRLCCLGFFLLPPEMRAAQEPDKKRSGCENFSHCDPTPSVADSGSPFRRHERCAIGRTCPEGTGGFASARTPRMPHPPPGSAPLALDRDSLPLLQIQSQLSQLLVCDSEPGDV